MKETAYKPLESSSASSSRPTNLGSTVVLKGDLTGSEDLLVEGQFDGTINLREHCLTIGARGQVKAEIQATRVIIEGSVTGNITARERIEIRKTGRVMGDLVAPGIAIEDGAYFKGSIEILREEAREAAAAFSASAVEAAND
ncbi:MAG: polymer-forming cytoskeletal protein [Acidobacteriia bacterium]|nr:polymer-forming cytoskeletal protein [Terriglobia bacterium]